MSSILYSTRCSIRNNLYRLCISVDNEETHSNNPPSTIDASDFTSTDISLDAIKPSLTRISFELINEKKQTNIPKIIILSHLLDVQQTKSISKKSRRKFNNSLEKINNSDATTPILQRSEETNYSAMNSNTSQTPTTQTPTPRRQFDFNRMFSTQTSVGSEVTLPSKTAIKIRYVDVSNWIRWSIKTLAFEVETEEIAKELYVNLNLCLSTLKQRPRRLLAFVNPFGGKGRARFVYEKAVLPIFEEANISVNSIFTERANHARDYVIKEDLSNYDGLVCVGGDGMFAELCHGLLLRTSQEAHLNIDDRQVNIIRPDLRIGIIPAGSTDAVVFGTTGLNDPVTSALQIIVGETLSIDIATVHNEKGFVRFMATMLAYGFFGDIIQQSDKWRCLGPLRYDLSGFCQFILNKSYHSELTITLSSNDDSSAICQPDTEISLNNNSNKKPSSVVPDSHNLVNTVNSTTNENNQVDPTTKVVDKLITPALVFCSRNCETCALHGKHDAHKVPSFSQIKRVGRYTTINCLNMPGRCAKSKFGMSPFVHLGDGTLDLILVKRSWRTGFLRFLWQVANDGRSVTDLPNVERYRVREVLIHPLHTDRIRLGNWACDGELISATEIFIRIHRQVLNLFASGIQFATVEKTTPIKKVKIKKVPAPSTGENNKALNVDE